jgi:DNA-binding transcriptional regulator YhcF (GntR family)
MPSVKMRTRPPIKRSLIEESLRREIVSGRIRPGGRMPTRSEIETRFAAGPFTVQRAIDRLAGDGFVVARGPQGTFVAERPPHLCCYALVFREHPSESRFWSALWKEASNVERSGPRKVEVFDRVGRHTGDSNYERLFDAVKAQRLAGLIFANEPTYYHDTPILTEPGMPRVALMRDRVAPGVSAVELDLRSFLNVALDFFAASGRRRLAVLSATMFRNDTYQEVFSRGAEKRGLMAPNYWQQQPDYGNPKAIHNCVHLLMRGAQRERPDCLFIADDNLVEEATAALATTGLNVPGDVEVLAHCNFPWPAPSSTPVRRIGFDARQIIEGCIQSIDLQRRNKSPAAVIRVPAVLDAKLSQ